jgi:hypothetical protein
MGLRGATKASARAVQHNISVDYCKYCSSQSIHRHSIVHHVLAKIQLVVQRRFANTIEFTVSNKLIVLLLSLYDDFFSQREGNGIAHKRWLL